MTRTDRLAPGSPALVAARPYRVPPAAHRSFLLWLTAVAAGNAIAAFLATADGTVTCRKGAVVLSAGPPRQ